MATISNEMSLNKLTKSNKQLEIPIISASSKNRFREEVQKYILFSFLMVFDAAK